MTLYPGLLALLGWLATLASCGKASPLTRQDAYEQTEKFQVRDEIPFDEQRIDSAQELEEVLRPLNATVNGTKSLPHAIIIGAKKSGTRALLRFLGAHPGVKASKKEGHFFDRNYHRGMDWYRDTMPPSLPHQLTIEKTPSYFITPSAPQRIFTMSPNTPLILVVRDPVTRALSDYAQSLSKRMRPGPSFEAMAFNASGHVADTWGAIRIGLYAQHLARWFEYFPRDKLHIVSGERLISDPGGEIMKVQTFLGLEPVITRDHFYFNATKGFPCMKSLQPGVTQPRCLGKTKGRPHPTISSQSLEKLQSFYRPHNEKFYGMIGIDMEWERS